MGVRCAPPWLRRKNNMPTKFTLPLDAIDEAVFLADETGKDHAVVDAGNGEFLVMPAEVAKKGTRRILEVCRA